MGAAEVVAQLSPRGENANEPVPTSEKQIRALTLLAQPADRCQAWNEARKLAGKYPVTSGLVSKAVRKMIRAGAEPRTAPRTPKKPKPKRVLLEVEQIKTIRDQLSAIREATAGTKGARKIEAAIENIEALLPK